jgi:NADH-quinone oxidoreductase subunit C
VSANLDWVEKIKTTLGSKLLGYRESAPGEPEFKVASTEAPALLIALKQLEGGPFDHLSDLTAYDEHPKKPRYHVVYELISMLRKQRCSVIGVCESDEKPQAPSVVMLWAGANWLEREAYDMMGIEFTGHPDLRRILLPTVFQGYPLRKDFVVDYRQPFPEPVNSDDVFDPFGNNIVEPKE